jgi:hypothetical protein
MTKADWSRRFDNPIPMPDGSTVQTIGEAAAYAAKLPKRIGKSPPWQHVARDLSRASKHPDHVLGARASFYSALYGEDDQHRGEREWTQAG